MVGEGYLNIAKNHVKNDISPAKSPPERTIPPSTQRLLDVDIWAKSRRSVMAVISTKIRRRKSVFVWPVHSGLNKDVF